jgi:hypothetical protein
MRPVKQIADASLDHQHRQGENRAHAEPPTEGSHRRPRPERRPTKKPRLTATLAEGFQAVKLTASFHQCLRNSLG